MENSPQRQIKIFPGWGEVIDEAVKLGYRGKTNILDNNAKSGAMYYLRIKGIEPRVERPKGRSISLAAWE